MRGGAHTSGLLMWCVLDDGPDKRTAKASSRPSRMSPSHSCVVLPRWGGDALHGRLAGCVTRAKARCDVDDWVSAGGTRTEAPVPETAVHLASLPRGREGLPVQEPA